MVRARRLGVASIAHKPRSTFSTSEKKAYIGAVQCLAKLPPKTSRVICPGCRNRYDDFVATHIQQSFTIHVTGNFLTWVSHLGDQALALVLIRLSSTVTSLGHTSRPYAKSVATRGTSLTTVIPGGTRTPRGHHCLMALKHQSRVKEHQVARTKHSQAFR